MLGRWARMLLQVILESQPEEFRVFFCKFECCYKNTFYYAILKLYYDKHDHKSILSVQNEILYVTQVIFFWFTYQNIFGLHTQNFLFLL